MKILYTIHYKHKQKQTMFEKQSLPRTIFLSFLLVILGFRAHAQLVTNYTVTAGSNQSLEDMSSGTTTLIGASQGPVSSAVTSIGFEVYFMGSRFTDFSVNAGGVLRFGTTVINNDANTMNIAGQHRVCAFANSTPGIGNGLLWKTHSTGKVHYKVVGSAPNRKLVVEWLNMSLDGSSTSANATWQAHIFETAPGNTDGGVIRIIFGQMNVGAFSNPTGCAGGIAPRVGIGFGGSSNQFIAMDSDQHPTVTGSAISYTGTNEACFTSSPILLNSATNGSRKFYNFNPASPNGNITTFSYDCISANSVRLMWTEDATNEMGYLLYRSTDNVNFTLVNRINAGTLEYIDTGLLPSTTYYYRLYVHTEGRISSLSANGSISATTLPLAMASIISIKSGNWNDPTVWTSGTVPTATDNVVIGCAGSHTVTINSSTATFNNASSVAIPDNTPSGGVATGNTIPAAATLIGCATCAFSQVTVPPGTYTGIHSLNFSITHSWLADLDIYLLAPNGTVFLVSTDNGSSEDNYTNTTIQDGNPNITTGTPPFTGTYSLEVGTLAAYAGAYAGNWRLYAIDDEGGISGSITNFTLNLTLPTIGAVCNNLTINNGSTIQYANNSSLTVNGNLLNNGTLNLSGTNTILDVKGNFTNNQTFTAGNSSNVIFSGSSLQNISNTQLETVPYTLTNTTDFAIGDPSSITVPDNTVPTAATLAACTNCAVSTVTVPPGTYTALQSINFSIAHTWTGDLGIYLVSPNGTVFLISDDNGGSGDNYTNTTISDAGVTSITAGTAPFTGTFRPEGVAFSTYSGTYPGTWTLYVLDDAPGDSGTLLDFTLTLAQAIPGAVLNVHHLTMNGSGGASMTNTNMKVAGTGTFNNGILNTGINRVDFLAGSSVSGGSNGSHIAGTARKIGNTPFTFPIGASGYYAGIGFTPSGTTALSDHFTASYFRVAPNPYDITQKEASIDHVGNCEYWMFDRTNGSQSATVSLHFDNTRSCGVDNTPQLIVCRWDGTKWTNGGNGGVSGSFVTSATTFASFSPFSLGSSGSSNPLPVGLLYFKAKGVEDDAVLNWETEFEMNSKLFEIERSTNGKDFEVISRQEALGRASRYNFTDRGIGKQANVVYYRLKNVDKDGRYTYSNIESVNFAGKQFALVSVVPNPIQSNFSVVYDLPAEGLVEFHITDALGKTVERRLAEGKAGRNDFLFEKSEGLASGVYILSVKYDGATLSKKIVK